MRPCIGPAWLCHDMGFFTAHPQSSFRISVLSFDVYFSQKMWATKHHRCRDTFICKLERMADTNEWSVFLMTALATFSCCVASLNIPSLSQSSPCKATELKTVSAHIYGRHHGIIMEMHERKKLKAKKKENRVSHKTETTRWWEGTFSPFCYFSHSFKRISPFPFISFFLFLMKFLPCSHFFPERGINSGLSVRRCVEWQSQRLFDSPGDWPFHCLWQHTCCLTRCWGDTEEQQEREREKDWAREVGVSGGGLEKD